MKRLILRSSMTALAALIALILGFDASAITDGPYDLVYDAATGVVELEIPAGPITIDFQLIGGPFKFENLIIPPANVAAFPILPINSSIITAVVIQPQSRGLNSLGQLLEPGLTEQQFNDSFTSAVLGGNNSSRVPLNLVYVPEPTSLALTSLGALALMRRRHCIA